MPPPDEPPREGTVFFFEDLGDDLPRPPLAALRLFRHAGVRIALKTWGKIPVDVRWAMAAEGAKNQIDETVSRALFRHISLRDLKLMGEPRYSEGTPLPGVVESLGLGDNWRARGWPSLRPFDRFVLNHLAGNTRLLWRAFEEISGLDASPVNDWSGPLAHAEVRIRAPKDVSVALVRLLVTEKLLDGRALILARASGVRAARAVGEFFDLYADLTPGVIELDWRVRDLQATVVWQAHVSTHLGEFFPAASLLAATTAAVCLYDMIKEFDAEASVGHARLIEEAWEVGKFESDEATRLYTPPPR